MQGSLVARKVSVRPSVCPSIKCVDCDKMEEKSVQIFIPYERSFSLVFGEEECLMGGGRPLLPEILGQPARWSKIADFEPILARSVSGLSRNT